MLRLHYITAAKTWHAMKFWSLYSSVFKIYYVLLSFLMFVTPHGSAKPVCHGDAKVLYGYPLSIMIISMFYYGLLRSDAVSCILTKA